MAKISEKVKIPRHMTPTVALHYVKLVLRSALLLSATVAYVVGHVNGSGDVLGGLEQSPVLLWIIWGVFLVGILLRFFPSKLESMGCQKQFKRNYREIPHKSSDKVQHTGLSTFAVFSAWIALNATIGALHYAGLFDKGILILIAMAYSVCDVICILFFCPFQTWFMKNRCCVSCRIYNWDYAMMFTPLLFVPDVLTHTLLALGVLLVLRWEITYRLHPERFNTECNVSLSCKNCKEKLCHHKKQLRHFILAQKLKLKNKD